MRTAIVCFRALLGLVLACAGPAALAADTLKPGQRLSDAQVSAYEPLPAVTFGASELRVLPPQVSEPGTTLVLDARGRVGLSRHEVMVTRATEAQLAQAVAGLQPPPVAYEYFELTGIALVRFADFEQAVAAFGALRDRLPEAGITLPIQYGRPRPQ